MKTKELVIMALFVGIGAALHSIIPGFGAGGMKPDFSLLMMFLAIILFPDKKNVIILGLATGIISGLTTTFPAGFIPNIIDKLITAFVFYGLFLVVKKSRSVVSNAVLTAIGTIVSGTIFLGSALLIVGLPSGFTLLFSTIVVPTSLLNTIAIVVVYPIVAKVMKRSNMTFA
ncbi:tryptophan transporter [Bacillus andreraoultii]|uniref:tryptophan transporter n=1 Tax=Bacillus andreraoultii TaxID=1499685 RepID=UPI00053AD197|nr:tryptophan transporter [Bacillus andreraoultii]